MHLGRGLQVGFRIDVGDYASPVCVGFAFSGGEHAWDALRLSEKTSLMEKMDWGASLPKVIELAVPRPFLKSTSVNCADAIVHAIDADFIGPESDNVTMFDVSGMDRADLLIFEPLYKDP